VPILRTNFSHLQEHDPQLLRLGMLAEKYFAEDPNTCLLKLRQLAELLAQQVAARSGLYLNSDETQLELLRRLKDSGILSHDIAQLFHSVRKAGNDANHAIQGDHRTALACLKICWQLSLWFHRTFKNAQYKSGAFIPPAPPANESAELKAELNKLTQTLKEWQTTHQETAQQLEDASKKLQQAKDDQAFWEQMALETDQAKAALEKRLADQQKESAAQPKEAVQKIVAAANNAAGNVYLDEAESRLLIDQQLRDNHWEVDSVQLKYSKGARPEANKNRAIAEWPTESGPADYALFVGLECVAVIEAKRRNKDVVGAIDQAKRYARGCFDDNGALMKAQWGEFRVPIVFSTNGRPFQRQFKEVSGIWFCDLRQSNNLRKPLDGWYTP